MHQIINILIIVSIPFLGIGQSTAFTEPTLMAKIAPLSLIDAFGNTSCLLSLETMMNADYSISIDGGFFYHSIAYGLQNNRGWRTGLEFRRYFENKKGRYLATSITYKDQSYEFTETLIFPNDNQYEKDNAYTKQVATFNLLYGIQNVVLDKRFFMNTYVGAGIRYKKTQSVGLTLEENEYRDYGDSQVLTLMNETGNRWLPNIVAGFKLGWVLK